MNGGRAAVVVAVMTAVMPAAALHRVPWHAPAYAQGRTVAAQPGPIERTFTVCEDGAVPAPIPYPRIVVAGQDATTHRGDLDGRFSLMVPAGGMDVVIGKSGFIPATVRVTSETPAADICLSRAAAIAGFVQDENGDPVVGVRVGLEAGDGSSPGTVIAATRTDDRGEYRIGGLRAGEYLVSAGITSVPLVGVRMVTIGGAGGRIYYPDAPTAEVAAPVRLSAGDERSGISFVVPAVALSRQVFQVSRQVIVSPADRSADARDGTAGISGSVAVREGQPLPNAQVMAVPVDNPAVYLFTPADANGRFAFSGLRPGEFRILASKMGYSMSGSMRVDMAANGVPLAGERVVLTDGAQVDGVEVTLSRWPAVSGRVTDEYGDPVAGARVQLLERRYEAGRSRLMVAAIPASSTDDRGAYRLYGMAPGEYIVTATVGDVASTNLSGYARSYYSGAANVEEAYVVTVESGRDLFGIDIPLTAVPTWRVSGQIVDGNGIGRVPGSLTLTPAATGPGAVDIAVGARILPEGIFEFPNVPPGDYVIRTYQGTRGRAVEGDFGTWPVTVGQGDVTGLTLRLAPAATIAGRVSFNGFGGRSMPRDARVEIAAVPVDFDAAPSPYAMAETRQDGSFEMRGITGQRRFEVLRAPPGWTVEAITLDGQDVTDRPVSVGRPDRPIESAVVTLTDRVGTLVGRLADERNRPVAGAVVVAYSVESSRWYPMSRYLRSATTDGEGRFSLASLPSDTYYVAAVAGGTGVEWQDPARLDALRFRATVVTPGDGETSVTVRPPAAP